jgi:hypothetical protein
MAVNLYRPGIEPLVLLKNLLGSRTSDIDRRRHWPSVIPPRGQFFAVTHEPTGLKIKLEHNNDGLFLIVGDDIAIYPVVAMSMPKLKWQRRFPCYYLIQDSLGRRVKGLFVHVPTKTIGSRRELEAAGIYVHSSRDLKPLAQSQRRLDKLFADVPDADYCREQIRSMRNSIRKLMQLRPTYPWIWEKRQWMRLILEARYGFQGSRLEEETTVALMQYNHRPAYRPKQVPHFWRSLGAFNEARRQEQVRAELAAEPLPIGYHS